MIELVRAGRTPEELAKEFEPSAQTIRNWVAQADRDAGRRKDGLTMAEHDELSRLRREYRQVKLEREILSKAAAWFARETDVIPEGFQFVNENRARYPSCSIAITSRRRPRRALLSSSSSRVSTIRADDTHRSGICHPSTLMRTWRAACAMPPPRNALSCARCRSR
jgi:transposase